MTEELQVLWSLKALDEQQVTLKNALARFPEQRAELEHRIQHEKGRLELLKNRLADLQKNRRVRERDIEAASTEEKRFQSQLFAVKKNDEYTALLHEIEAAKAKRSAIETEVLVMLDEEDKVLRERPAIEQELATAERETAERRAHIDREEAEDRERLAAVEAERARHLARLPIPTRSRYERIHVSREGRAVVAIQKGACGGCYRGQPPQTLQEARRGDRLLLCDGCGRLMIWPPGTG